MILLLLGAPGAGKGTQAALLAEKLNIPHISTGDIFRKNMKDNTYMGVIAGEYVNRGELVPDGITLDMVKERLLENDCAQGFILDGYPRNISQAYTLDSMLKDLGKFMDYVINIKVSDSEIIKRLSGRRICPECGKVFNLNDMDEKDSDYLCSQCGKKLAQREDDMEDKVIIRLEVYHGQTKPLLDYYREKGKLKEVDGEKEIKEIIAEMLNILGVSNDIN